MNNVSKFIYGCVLASLTMMAACTAVDNSDNEPSDNLSAGEKHTCVMVLNADKPAFDEDATRSAEGWEEGDKIYLTFTTDGGTSYGDAVYTNDAWALNYYGDLVKNTITKCSAVYFEKVSSVNNTQINLSAETSIYEDVSGSYTFDGTTLSVTAALSPKTGRIRFAGNSGDVFTVHGMANYDSYNAETGEFTSKQSAFAGKVNSNGYTNYYYCWIADDNDSRMNVMTAESGFSRILPSTVLKVGESGYMSLPTLDSHVGWQNVVIVKVNGVEFKMIPVNSYFLAETETTEAQYSAVMGGDKSTQMPQTGLSSDQWSSFVAQLKSMTSLNFQIPSTSQWQTGYKGGSISKGYSYSGSNDIDEVAWYSGNSGDKKHVVKSKKANELGLYDMCGNVSEMVDDYYNYGYGGSYISGAADCGSSSYINFSADYVGLRLLLRR